MLFSTSTIGTELPIPDLRPLVLRQECVNYPQGGNILFKAENNKRRFIVRSVHCWKT